MKQLLFFLLFIGSFVEASHLYSIILAGGSGERLWPISRKGRPKQLVSLDEKETFLDQAIERLKGVVPEDNIWICTAEQHVSSIKKHAAHRVKNIIIEPAARDTGPAILYACLQLQQHDPDATVIFLPSDAYIPEKENAIFRSYVSRAFEFCQKNNCVTLFGLQPTFPATGYGYIEFDKKSAEEAPYKVVNFHEKPWYERAEQYVAQGMLWNQCVFCSKVSVLIAEFKKHAPGMYRHMKKFMSGSGRYEAIEKDSIDFAVMEKSENVWVLPVAYTWCDVGNIGVFLTLKKEQGLLTTPTVEYDTYNNLVDVPNKLVALLGVDNLCVVEHNDVLFVGRREIIEQTRELVGQLKKINSDYL